MVPGRTDPPKVRTRSRLSAVLVIGGGSLAAVLWLPWPAVLAPAALAGATLAVLEPRQLSALFNKWLVLGLVLTVLVPVWLLGTPAKLDVTVAGTSAKSDEASAESDEVTVRGGSGTPALIAGATMAVRVMTTLAVLLLIGGSLAPARVSRTLGRLAGREVGLACAIGVNLLPAIVEILRRTTLAMRLRGGFSYRRVTNLRRWLAAVGVQTVRLTEDVAESLLLAQAPATVEREPEQQSPP